MEVITKWKYLLLDSLISHFHVFKNALHKERVISKELNCFIGNFLMYQLCICGICWKTASNMSTTGIWDLMNYILLFYVSFEHSRKDSRTHYRQ